MNLWGGHADCCSDWTQNISVCLKAGNIPHQSKRKKSLHNFVWVTSYQNNRHRWCHFGLQCPPVLRASIQALLQDVRLATKAWLIKHHPSERENRRRRSTITLSFFTDITEFVFFSFDLNSQRNAVFDAPTLANEDKSKTFAVCHSQSGHLSSKSTILWSESKVITASHTVASQLLCTLCAHLANAAHLGQPCECELLWAARVFLLLRHKKGDVFCETTNKSLPAAPEKTRPANWRLRRDGSTTWARLCSLITG